MKELGALKERTVREREEEVLEAVLDVVVLEEEVLEEASVLDVAIREVVA